MSVDITSMAQNEFKVRSFVGLAASLILLTVIVKQVQAEQERVCTVTSANLNKLTFDVFDQGLDSPLSWRCLAEKGELKQAQELIDRYILINRAELDQYKIDALTFHSGQLAATDGRYEEAIEKFYLTVRENDELARFLSWNEYVLGTIYFLQGSIRKLEQEIEKIEVKNIEMDVDNLRILKNFHKCPNETYKEVYSRTSSCLNTH
ncbi:MAG: hypothetical protein OXE42_17845 [Gammaproteobacteria bacterium]|nr:hypothetical protein [Gammaproteobacteria bacterium]